MAGSARPCSTSAVHIVSLGLREAPLSPYVPLVVMVNHHAGVARKDYTLLSSELASGGMIQKATRATVIPEWNRECMKRHRLKPPVSSGAGVTTCHPGIRRRDPTERGSAIESGVVARPSAVKYSLNRLKNRGRSNEWTTLDMFLETPKP